MHNISKILIVDDDSRMCKSLTALLSNQGYELKTCNSGKEAIEYLNKDAFDLVLLDMVIPDMDGYQIMDHINNKSPDTLVIVITGHTSMESAIEALRKGAYDYIKKPFEPEKLLMRVKNGLDHKKLKSENECTNKNLTRLDERIKLLSLAIEQSSEGIAVVDLDGNLEYLNGAFAKMHGYSAEELVGKNLSVFHTPEQMPSVEAANLQIKETGDFKGELWHVRRDGNVFPTMMHNSLIWDDRGNPIGMMGTLRDITKRKQAEEALKKNEREKSAILNAMSELVAYQDTDHNVLWTNKAAADSVGEDQEDLKGRKCYELWAGREEPCEICPVAKAIETGEMHRDEIATPDERVWVITGYPVKKETGELIGVVEVTLEDTKRKRAEEELRESEERFRSIVENTDAGYFFIDKDGLIQKANKSWVKMYGYSSPDEIIGKHFTIIQKADDVERANEFVNGIMRGEPKYTTGEFSRKCKDGTIGYHTFSARPVSLFGKVIGIEGFIIDTTERKKMEVELQETKKELDIIFNSVPALVWSKSNEGKYLRVNRTYCETVGLSMEKILGRTDYDLYPADIADQYSKYDQEIIHSKKPVLGIEERHLKPSGDHGWSLTQKLPYYDAEGNTVGTIGFAIDITELKRAEKTLRESEEKYHSIMEAMADAAYICSSDFRIEYMNPAMIRRIGRDAIGEPCYKVVHGLDEKCPWCVLGKVVQGEHVAQDVVSPKDNRSYHIIYSPIHRADDSISQLVVSRDVTKIKAMEHQLRQAQKMESIGTLAGGIAHDFNNLLYVIMGNISMTKDDVKPEYGVADFLNEAEEASLKAKELANQLITFSEGGAPVKKVSSIVNSVKETTNLILSDSNVKSEFIFPDDLWLVEFDEGQMKQAVRNLIVNAVESMPDSEAIVVKAENFKISSGTIEKSLPLSEGKYVKISIQDYGAGIPEEHFSKIFDPYFSTKERGIEKGMGLGLATTYSIINGHDGHITVESEVGVGTTFTVYLSAAVEEIVGIEPVKMVEPEKPAVRTGRILVMDDEEMNRRVSKEMLSRLGYEPELAKDGAETIELYKKSMDSGKPFDAVILDLTIKGGAGGKEVIKQLMEIDHNIKAIVSSGYSNDPVMTNFIAYGFIGALPKPYPMKDLKDMLNQVLGKS